MDKDMPIMLCEHADPARCSGGCYHLQPHPLGGYCGLAFCEKHMVVTRGCFSVSGQTNETKGGIDNG